MRIKALYGTVVAALLPAAMLACSAEDKVSFARDVKPTLDRYCLECHQPGGAGFAASGLDLSSYDGVMKGTRNGPMVIPGDSMGSNLVVLMEGRADPSIKMPHGTRIKVSAAEIETVKTWIDQGAEDN
ncbi:MAG TPA: c-type cytochrome domain-containing protein [Xanthomonadales bacterium]|nr:c-type cytochrome domain-containing protein [Xanthomonadales bacterium]